MLLGFTFSLKISIGGRKASSRRKRKEGMRDAPRAPLFLEFIDREMKRVRRRCRRSTCDNYMTARRSFAAFLGGADIPLREVTPQLVSRYSQWLSSRGVSLNTSSCYMRSLRAMYNAAAVKHRIRRCSPFSAVFTGNVPTRKRALGEAEMRRIGIADVEEDTVRSWARDVFMFCFYAMGMPFADAMLLRKSRVSDGTITYLRRKTGREVTVGIEPCMERIMRKYAGGDADYVFPVPTGDRFPGGKGYARLLKCYNAALKVLSRDVGLCLPLTSYVARHTWASLAYRRNVPLHVIAQALGHSSPRVTMTYIRELDGNTVRRANKKIIRGFTSATSVQ